MARSESAPEEHDVYSFWPFMIYALQRSASALGCSIYIPLLTERDVRQYEAINILLLWSKQSRHESGITFRASHLNQYISESREQIYFFSLERMSECG